MRSVGKVISFDYVQDPGEFDYAQDPGEYIK